MTPYLSVVICTYNRDRFIVACLESLAVQTLSDEKFEVIVVNNHCTDNTESLVLDFLQRHPERPFRMVFEANKGLSHARNRGIAEARGEVILYLDDDAECQPDLLETHLAFFTQTPDAAGAGGRILPRYSEAPEPPWMSRWLDGYIARMDPGGEQRIFKGRMKYPFGCNMAYRKKFLEQIGGFNTEITFRGDDKYIFLMVKAINPNIFYLPKALVYHNIPGSRLQSDYFKTLFLKTGNEERVRVKMAHGVPGVLRKLLEYCIKFGISLVLWVKYAITHTEVQGRYVMLSQWYTLNGFFRKNVTVR